MISKTQDIRTPCNTDVYIFINNNTDIIYCLISLFAESFAENVINKAFNKHAVVSFTGTWIETVNFTSLSCQFAVVSFTGTWIETCNLARSSGDSLSYPLRVRGLKLFAFPVQTFVIGRILYGYVD